MFIAVYFTDFQKYERYLVLKSDRVENYSEYSVEFNVYCIKNIMYDVKKYGNINASFSHSG